MYEKLLGILKPYVPDKEACRSLVGRLLEVFESGTDELKEDANSRYQDGYDEGYADGWQQGWDEGYDVGLAEGENRL